jgi:hypothetical protein
MTEGIGLEGARGLDDDELADLFDDFRTVTALSNHLGCSHSWLGKLLAERGLRERKRGVYEHPMRTGTERVEKADGLTIEDMRIEADDVIEKIWAAADAAFDADEALEIEQDLVHIRVDTEKPIGLIAIGDLHIGSAGVNPRIVRAMIDAVTGVDGLYTILNGDEIEGALPGCPDSMRVKQPVRVAYQRRLAENIAERLSDRCVGVTCGQHEFFTQRAADFDFAGELAKIAKAAYLGTGGTFLLDVGGHRYSVACWHKFKGNSKYDGTAAAKCLCQEHGPFDISIVADRHAPAASDGFRNGNIMRVFLRGGTIKLNDEYGKSLGYMNSAMQFPLVILWPGERKMWRTGDLQEGLEYLAYLRQ